MTRAPARRRTDPRRTAARRLRARRRPAEDQPQVRIGGEGGGGLGRDEADVDAFVDRFEEPGERVVGEPCGKPVSRRAASHGRSVPSRDTLDGREHTVAAHRRNAPLVGRLGLLPLRAQGGPHGAERRVSGAGPAGRVGGDPREGLSGRRRAQATSSTPASSSRSRAAATSSISVSSSSSTRSGASCPTATRLDGFREEDCIPCAPRPVDEMWTELLARVDQRRAIRPCASCWARWSRANADRLRIWPAAQNVHHAYRSGLLEHILQDHGSRRLPGRRVRRPARPADRRRAPARHRQAPRALVRRRRPTTRSKATSSATSPSASGCCATRCASSPGLPPDLAVELEHLILSHHGARELGSPVEPMTIEAFILAAADDLDAKIHQVRQHLARRRRGRAVHDAITSGSGACCFKPVDRRDHAPSVGRRRRGAPGWRGAPSAWSGARRISRSRSRSTTIPPFLVGGLRYAAAGLMLAVVLRARGHRLPAAPRVAHAGRARLLHADAAATAASSGRSSTSPSGLTAVLVGTTPFWMVGVDAMLPSGDRLHGRAVVGLVDRLHRHRPARLAGHLGGRRGRARLGMRRASRAGGVRSAGRSRRPTRAGTCCRLTCSASAAVQMLCGGASHARSSGRCSASGATSSFTRQTGVAMIVSDAGRIDRRVRRVLVRAAAPATWPSCRSTRTSIR